MAHGKQPSTKIPFLAERGGRGTAFSQLGRTILDAIENTDIPTLESIPAGYRLHALRQPDPNLMGSVPLYYRVFAKNNLALTQAAFDGIFANSSAVPAAGSLRAVLSKEETARVWNSGFNLE